jgi:hypothetical protein
MRKTSIALAVALLAAGCTQRPSLESGRAHAAGDAAKSPTPVAQAPVPPGDPHAVDRATTPSDYCVGCHVGLDDDNDHPVRVDQQAAALASPGMTFWPPASSAIVLRDGLYVECTSCHDDGSAGYAKRTVLGQNLCAACHDKVGTATWPTVTVTAPAAGSTVSGTIAVTATATAVAGVARGELWIGTSPGAATRFIGLAQPVGDALAFSLDTTTLSDGTYYLMVRAYDANNVWGEGMVEVRVANAVTPPAGVVTITSPASGAVVTGYLTISATAQGAVRTELWGGPAGSEPEYLTEVASGGAVTFEMITNALPNGPYTFVVRGFDAAGQSGSATVTVTVSNALSVAIESPAAGTVVSGTFTVVARTTGAVTAELLVAGRTTATADASGGVVTFAVDSTGLQDGPIEIAVRAVDVSGWYESASTSVVVDNPHPPAEVLVLAPAPNALVRGTIQVLAKTTGAVGTAELWSLREVGDGVVVATAPVQPDGSVAFSLDTASYPDGWALLTVNVFDPWGGNSWHSVGVIFDNTGPAIAVTSPAPGATVRSTVTITATASDASGVASVAFYVDGALLATRTSAPYSVTWTPARRSGAHTLTAVAADVLGNQATSAPVVVSAK